MAEIERAAEERRGVGKSETRPATSDLAAVAQASCRETTDSSLGVMIKDEEVLGGGRGGEEEETVVGRRGGEGKRELKRESSRDESCNEVRREESKSSAVFKAKVEDEERMREKRERQRGTKSDGSAESQSA